MNSNFPYVDLSSGVGEAMEALKDRMKKSSAKGCAVIAIEIAFEK